MLAYIHMKNAFSDRASIIPRLMLAEPGRRWVLRDFTGPDGLSLGMAQGVVDYLAELGCLERVSRGPASYFRLSDPDLLLSEWVSRYRLDPGRVHSYYWPHGDFLARLKKLVPAEKYALALHAGANLLTGYVKTESAHLYLRLGDWDRELPALREALELKRLAEGGNVHFIRPFYKTGAFYGARRIKGYSVVSPLQLYLDLYNFQPRGREHAEYLRETLKRKGGGLA